MQKTRIACVLLLALGPVLANAWWVERSRPHLISDEPGYQEQMARWTDEPERDERHEPTVSASWRG